MESDVKNHKVFSSYDPARKLIVGDYFYKAGVEENTRRSTPPLCKTIPPDACKHNYYAKH
jgi:hypothetical protein